VFGLLNPEGMIHEMIDLHGMHSDEALDTVQYRLTETMQALKRGEVKPNLDANNHVFKIICGAGKHSVGRRGVLKVKVFNFLKEGGYDFHCVQEHGVLLVRLIP